jgi:Ca-activated chloride channel family protein
MRSAFFTGLLLILLSVRTWAQDGPLPVPPAIKDSPQPAAPQTATPAQSSTPGAASVERRTPHPNATSEEPVSGPLSGSQTGSQAGQPPAIQQPTRPGDVGTIRVETRLVNVAVNVADAHGAPVGGLNKQDFQLFEDGKPQQIAIFDRESVSPLSIVLAIDASETVMTSQRLEREAAKRFIRAILREQDELELMEFSDTVREVVPFTNDAKRVEAGLSELKQGDETALYDAVFLASDELAKTRTDAGRRRVIVIISDGGDSTRHSRYTQAIEEAQRAGAIIYSIVIVPIASDAGRNTGGEHALIQLSQDTGGKYYYVVDPRDLEPAFRHVSEDLRTQYILSYYAPQRGPANNFRAIKVMMANDALKDTYDLRYRTGYFSDGR